MQVLWCLANTSIRSGNREGTYTIANRIVVLCVLTQLPTFVPVSFVVFFFLCLDVDSLCLVAVDCLGCLLTGVVLVFFSLQVELVVYNGASAEILH